MLRNIFRLILTWFDELKIVQRLLARSRCYQYEVFCPAKNPLGSGTVGGKNNPLSKYESSNERQRQHINPAFLKNQIVEMRPEIKILKCL